MKERLIFHITHIDNLAGIINDNCLWSDAQRIKRGFANTGIGYTHIKDRRLRRPIPVGAKGMLGDYVPFYFCPRSVMLFVISRGQVPTYTGGQAPVIHLVSSVGAAISTTRPWAFTNLHAELMEADCFEDLSKVDELKWAIIESNTWGGDERRKFKQAEFLMHDFCPWGVFDSIGVMNKEMAEKVQKLLKNAPHSPIVRVEPSWYY